MLKFCLSFFEFNAQYTVAFFLIKGESGKSTRERWFETPWQFTEKYPQLATPWVLIFEPLRFFTTYYHRVDYSFVSKKSTHFAGAFLCTESAKWVLFFDPPFIRRIFGDFFDYNSYLAFYMTVFMSELDSTIVFIL